MRAKIDQNGSLWVERSGMFHVQECRLAAMIHQPEEGVTIANCSDFCPAFQEFFGLIHREDDSHEGLRISLMCFPYRVDFFDVLDERPS